MNNLQAIGEKFRQAREARDMELADVVEVTRIRLKYLQAIEAGDFEAISSRVQRRGFIRNYARVVGLDGEEILAEYEEARNPRRGLSLWRKREKPEKESAPAKVASSEPDPDATMTVNLPSRPAQVAKLDRPAATPSTGEQSTGNRQSLRNLLMIIIAAVFAGGLIIIGLNFVDGLTGIQEEETPAPDNPLVVLSPPALPGDDNGDGTTPRDLTPSPTASATAFVIPTPPPLPDGSMYITLIAERRVWVRLTVDGELKYEGPLVPERMLGYAVQDNFSIRTTDADGVLLLVNEEEYPLGGPNELVDVNFTTEGLQPPTDSPTLTPTLSATPTTTLSPPATITVTLTNTASPENEASPTGATFLFTATASPSPTGFVIAPPSGSGTPTQPTATTSVPLATTAPPVPSATSRESAPAASATPSATLTVTPAASPTRVTPTPFPSPAATLTASPFLPPRETRTPTLEK